MIPVTRTYLPPFEEYVSQLEKVWQNGWITNNGPVTRELSDALRTYLGVQHLDLVGNGTLALQIAIKALDLKGEIITTPFSYVATTTAILWENCQPVFVDIEDSTCCIDADQIEAAITDRTSAILATHVYGYPCDVEKIEQIAHKHGLKIIYDAAHAFGVKLHGQSLLVHGDVSTLSFHATKLFHTVEGGMLAFRDENVANRAKLMKQFGHIGEDNYRIVGINAKMSELHAAMGHCVLPKVEEIIAARRVLSEQYDAGLKESDLVRPKPATDVEYNYSYYLVIFPNHDTMMRVRQALVDDGIMPRRYFYPSLNTLPYLPPQMHKECPVSESIASRVLCLPLYYGLEPQDVGRVCDIINGCCRR